MADFMTSTHRTKWILTPQDIKHKYKVANQRAKQALEKVALPETFMAQRPEHRSDIVLVGLRIILIANSTVKYGTTRMEVDIDGSFSYAESQNDTKDSAEKRPKPLKVEEEQLLRAFYEFKIQDVCDAFKFPRKIQATALIYFKRFYLQWSVMEHHPKDIMLTCIYAACKAEENHVSAEELGKGIGQDHHVILNNEMLVFQSLGFDLIVYSPYRALEGYISDLEEFCGAKDDDQLVALKGSLETARMEADKIMRTDGPLLFPPGQLALTALHRANAVHGIFDFERYLRSVLSHSQPAHAISELTGSINAIDSLPAHAISELTGSINAIDSLSSLPLELLGEQIGKLSTPTSKDVKHIDRKLKSCLDPGSHDKSKKRKHRSKDNSNEVTYIS